jgi:hypothetical protein
MGENKTRASDDSVAAHLAAIVDESKRLDAQRLIDLMGAITGEAPRRWGPSMIGFGSIRYRYESGREGDTFLTGFAVRKSELVVYLVAEGVDQGALLTKLGRHKMGKSCLYLKRLADADQPTLQRLIENSVAALRTRYA